MCVACVGLFCVVVCAWLVVVGGDGVGVGVYCCFCVLMFISIGVLCFVSF